MLFLNYIFSKSHFSVFIFSIGILSISLSSCNTSKAKDKPESTNTELSEFNTDKDSSSNSSAKPINTVVHPISDKIKTKLTAFMGQKDADTLINYINEFQFVTTDVSFEAQWRKGEQLLEKISAKLNKNEGDGYNVMERMSILDQCFGLRASCDAECTIFIFAFDVTDLKELAKQTTGKADDQFISLMESIQGETIYYQKSWINTFARTWDYGGGSLLGDSSSYNFLKQSSVFVKQNKLFQRDIKSNRLHVLNDMSHNIYMYPKERVLAEIALIQKAQLLNATELKIVNQIKGRIEANDPKLQFGCDSPDADCDFGG